VATRQREEALASPGPPILIAKVGRMEKRTVQYANNPAEDIDWCTERGHRAYLIGVGPGVYRSPGLLITRGAQVIGVATMGDTLMYDGTLIGIRVPAGGA
jgi:hypothetical protein